MAIIEYHAINLELPHHTKEEIKKQVKAIPHHKFKKHKKNVDSFEGKHDIYKCTQCGMEGRLAPLSNYIWIDINVPKPQLKYCIDQPKKKRKLKRR